MEEKKILKRDTNSIDQLWGAYKQAVTGIQTVIDSLKQKFEKYQLEFPDDQIKNLINNKSAFDVWLDDIIFAEADKYRFQWEKEKTTQELTEQVKEPAGEACKQIADLLIIRGFGIQDFYGGFHKSLSPDNFLINKGQIGLKSGLKQIITDLLTIYLEGDRRTKAFQLAQDIIAKSEELKSLLPNTYGIISSIPMPIPGAPGLYSPGQKGIFSHIDGRLLLNEPVFAQL
ncbi:MAG: hypothetical protein AAGU19_08850 [Prolixibacteraceae bacterium]